MPDPTATTSLTPENRDRLAAWLHTHVCHGDDLRAERIGQGQGTANVMYRIGWAGRDMVLRHPPAHTITKTAGNVAREAKVLAALSATSVPHAAYVALCEDETLIGAPFLLTDYVDGLVPSDPLPDWMLTGSERAAIGLELVDGLAELATVDWRDAGLEGFGKPDGFLERQVDRWLWQLKSYQARELEAKPVVEKWLRDNLPAPGPIGIMHGDYSSFNTLFSAHPPARLLAILDWDTATIGEVLLDLGHLLARWDEPGETPTTLGSSDVSDRSGASSRAEMLDRYATRTGFDVPDVRYYEVLSLFKLACIMEGQYARHIQDRPNEPMGPYTNIGPGLMEDARRIALGEIH